MKLISASILFCCISLAFLMVNGADTGASGGSQPACDPSKKQEEPANAEDKIKEWSSKESLLKKKEECEATIGSCEIPSAGKKRRRRKRGAYGGAGGGDEECEILLATFEMCMKHESKPSKDACAGHIADAVKENAEKLGEYYMMKTLTAEKVEIFKAQCEWKLCNGGAEGEKKENKERRGAEEGGTKKKEDKHEKYCAHTLMAFEGCQRVMVDEKTCARTIAEGVRAHADSQAMAEHLRQLTGAKLLAMEKICANGATCSYKTDEVCKGIGKMMSYCDKQQKEKREDAGASAGAGAGASAGAGADAGAGAGANAGAGARETCANQVASYVSANAEKIILKERLKHAFCYGGF